MPRRAWRRPDQPDGHFHRHRLRPSPAAGTNNFNVVNSAGTLDLTVTGSTFGNSLGATANDGLFIQANGTALVRASVTGLDLRRQQGATISSSPPMPARRRRATSRSATTISARPVRVRSAAASRSARPAPPICSSPSRTMTSRERVRRAIAVAVTASTAAGEVHGTIAGNTIGTAGVVGSGSATGNGINAQIAGAGTMTLLVDDNDSRAGAVSASTPSQRDRHGSMPRSPTMWSTRRAPLRSIRSASSAGAAARRHRADLPGAQRQRCRHALCPGHLRPHPLQRRHPDAGLWRRAGRRGGRGRVPHRQEPVGGDSSWRPNALAGSGFFDTPGSAPVPLPIVPDVPMN